MIVNLIPMAGEGQRFKNAGYTTAKPLLDIEGIPMFVRAAKSLPPADEYIFVCRKDQVDEYLLNTTIRTYFPNSKIQGGFKLIGDLLEELDDKVCLLLSALDNYY
jgi:NDP-sugar pyrophosphorylase family protein